VSPELSPCHPLLRPMSPSARLRRGQRGSVRRGSARPATSGGCSSTCRAASPGRRWPSTRPCRGSCGERARGLLMMSLCLSNGSSSPENAAGERLVLARVAEGRAAEGRRHLGVDDDADTLACASGAPVSSARWPRQPPLLFGQFGNGLQAHVISASARGPMRRGRSGGSSRAESKVGDGFAAYFLADSPKSRRVCHVRLPCRRT